MLRNMIKLALLSVVAFCSWQTSSHYINEIVLELEQRQPSITDMIIKQQVQESLKEAEKEIAKVQEEEQIVIKQEEVTIKPAKPPKEEKQEEVVAKEETTTDEEQIVVDGELEESIDALQEQVENVIDVDVYTELTEADIRYIADYLIDHYFLFGYEYYSVETDPVRYERKKLAGDMEEQVIKSIGKLTGLIGSLTSLQSSDIQPILDETMIISDTFQTTYGSVGEKGEEFEAIYHTANQYFDTYIDGLTKINQVFKNIESATNKALVLPMMLKSINQDILPAIRDILDQGFALKEKTNKIYIEGVEGVALLTPEEVMAIIENPRSILSSTESKPQENTDTLPSEPGPTEPAPTEPAPTTPGNTDVPPTEPTTQAPENVTESGQEDTGTGE